MSTSQDHLGLASSPVQRAFVLAIAITLAACGKEAPTAAQAASGAGTGASTAAEHAGEKDGEHAEAQGGHAESGHAEGGDELKLTAEEAERAGVKTEAIQARPLGESITVTATVQPDQDRLAHVAPRIEGRVLSAPAKLGDRVRAGQTLATLDSVAVGEAHAARALAQADLRIADADFKRAEGLDAEEIIPRKDFLRARADRDKAGAALRAAADRLRLLGATPTASGRSGSGFAVTAPFAGTVIEKKATVGDLSTPSEPLFTVADLSRVWIQSDLPEAALAKVQIGAAAQISVPAYPGQTFNGRVAHIGAALAKETRTVAARIEVGNADGRLKPEMFATATIEAGGDKRNVIAIPDAAIVLMAGQPSVFVLENGAYGMRVVEPGERVGGRTVVKAGVTAGEQVVTAGAYALKARTLKSQLGHGH